MPRRKSSLVGNRSIADVMPIVAKGHIHYQSRGAPPADVIEALKAAKPEIVTLLSRLSIDATGALIDASGGDDLLGRLAKLGFRMRRYGDQAALDDETGQGGVPPMPLPYEFADRQRVYGVLLVALDAPDLLDVKRVEVEK